MKAVLISIRSKWVEKIVRGENTSAKAGYVKITLKGGEKKCLIGVKVH